MTSNEERREIAARLRGVTEEELRSMFLGEILDCAIGGRCLDNEGDIDERLILNRLADLIDRPTCRIIKGAEKPKHPWGICSRCSVLVDSRNATSNATKFLPTRFCPNCGAEVIEK